MLNKAFYLVVEIYATIIFDMTGLPDSEYDTFINTEAYKNFSDSIWSIVE